jgi:leucyl/phenylalanyl-tRNA--protein transferase
MIKINQWKFRLVDAQQSTKHLKSLGAKEIHRKDFLLYLNEALKERSRTGKWKL